MAEPAAKKPRQEMWFLAGAPVRGTEFDSSKVECEPLPPSVLIDCGSLLTVGRRTVKVTDLSLKEVHVAYFTEQQAAEHRFGEAPAGETKTFFFTEEGVWADPETNEVLSAFEWQ